MSLEMVLTCLLIFAARIADVTFGTLRMVAIVRGHRGLAWLLGSCESLIWITIVSKFISILGNPIYAVSFAVGYGTGGYVGVVIEQWFALGQQAVRIFTRNSEVSAALRTGGFVVTQFEGHGRDGAVLELFVKANRRDVDRLIGLALKADEKAFYTVEDVRLASSPRPQVPTVVGAVLGRK